jgi:hypothetical protein
MNVYGKITNKANVKLLQSSFEEERKFNNPLIAYKWIAKRYEENYHKYGMYLYEAEKINFIDTDVFRQAALHFKEHGCYTFYDFDMDAALYNAFWDREEYRRRNGMTAWARIDEKGNYGLVHVTGEMYGFLNYCPILRVRDAPDDEMQGDAEAFITTGDIDNVATLEELFKKYREGKIDKKTMSLP